MRPKWVQREGSPFLEIGLGANDDTRDIVHATEIDDLVIDDLHHVEGIS